jgi:hypothetical protein
MVFILIHGIDYVAWPRLIPLTDVIYYDGLGFRSGRHGMGIGGIGGKEMALKQPMMKWGVANGQLAEEVELGTMKKRLD